MPETKSTCPDCGNEYPDKDLIPYKYEPSIKVCESCLEERMNDE